MNPQHHAEILRYLNTGVVCSCGKCGVREECLSIEWLALKLEELVGFTHLLTQMISISYKNTWAFVTNLLWCW